MNRKTKKPVTGDIGDLTLTGLLNPLDGQPVCIRPERIMHKPLIGEDGFLRTTLRIPKIYDTVIGGYSRTTNRSKNELYAIMIGNGLSHYHIEGKELVYTDDPSLSDISDAISDARSSITDDDEIA